MLLRFESLFIFRWLAADLVCPINFVILKLGQMGDMLGDKHDRPVETWQSSIDNFHNLLRG